MHNQRYKGPGWLRCWGGGTNRAYDKDNDLCFIGFDDAGNSAYAGYMKRKFSAEDRRELFHNVTNPKWELLGDVFELALGMLTLAMRHPEKFSSWGTYQDMNACIQGLEMSFYRYCASESVELITAETPRKRSPPKKER